MTCEIKYFIPDILYYFSSKKVTKMYKLAFHHTIEYFGKKIDLNTQMRIQKEHDIFILYWTSAKRCADRLEISTRCPRWHPAKRQRIDFHSVKSRMFHNFLHGVSCSNIFTFSSINFLIENWFSINCIIIWEKKVLFTSFHYEIVLWYRKWYRC